MKNKELVEKTGDPIGQNVAQIEPAKIKQRIRRLVMGVVLAVGITLLILAATQIFPPEKPPLGQSDLPVLTISEGVVGGLGFEGYMAYDASELVNNNPWAEGIEVSTLPVFENLLTYDEMERVQNPDFERMQELLLEVVGRLGIDTSTTEITDNTPDNATQEIIKEKFAAVGEKVPEGYLSPDQVVFEDNGIEVNVDAQMTAVISFDPAVELADNIQFNSWATYEQTAAVARYLKEAYSQLIDMKNPQVNIYGGDYTIYEKQMYHIEFFDGSGDITDQILNYNFNRVAFYCNDDGKLFLARVFKPDLSHKVGEYPIITINEATRLLENGNYISTMMEQMPGAEYVKKTELVYRMGRNARYFMPYYRFYVELPSMQRDTKLKTYGIFYVPAVEGRYITNMPLWDGSF